IFYSHTLPCTHSPYTTLFRSNSFWGSRITPTVRHVHKASNRAGSRPAPRPRLWSRPVAAGAMSTPHTIAVLIPPVVMAAGSAWRSEEHTSELQSRFDLVCRLL